MSSQWERDWVDSSKRTAEKSVAHKRWTYVAITYKRTTTPFFSCLQSIVVEGTCCTWGTRIDIRSPLSFSNFRHTHTHQLSSKTESVFTFHSVIRQNSLITFQFFSSSYKFICLVCTQSFISLVVDIGEGWKSFIDLKKKLNWSNRK